MDLQRLNSLKGFDYYNLENAKQNNYAWSIGELGDYIYVGTGKNILLWIVQGMAQQIKGFQIPASIKVNNPDTTAEIWRYKKDGTQKWQRVFKAPKGIEGFRFMISHKLYGAREALYAAGSSNSKTSGIKIYKSYDGIVWEDVTGNIKGTTSRAMAIHNGKIYLATAEELVESPYLYSSADPEFDGWKTELDLEMDRFNPDKNPQGFLYNIASFNGHLYVSTGNENGVQVWRTKGIEPKLNRWVLVADNGFGDKANTWSLSMGVFKEHLYVSATITLPQGYLTPKGADLIRIDKDDNWELIVGGDPIIPIDPTKGVREECKSGYKSGFSNPLNLYVWQLKEYNGVLYATTFDHGINIPTILDIILLNKSLLKDLLLTNTGEDSEELIDSVIERLRDVVNIVGNIKYPYGFDLFISMDGVHFNPVILDGLGDPTNYGGRILFVDSKNELYIGTANPYEGCEVWKAKDSILWDYPQKEFNFDIPYIKEAFEAVSKLLKLAMSETQTDCEE